MNNYLRCMPVLLMFLSCGTPDSTTEVNLEVEELFSSACTGDLTHPDPVFVVIRTPEEFGVQLESSAWYPTSDAGVREQLPDVNFQTHVVLAAFLGTYPCVEDLLISSVVETAVDVRATVVIKHCEQGDLESSPYVFAKVPKIDKPYVKLEQVDGCD